MVIKQVPHNTVLASYSTGNSLALCILTRCVNGMEREGKVQNVECCGKQVSSDQGPEWVTQASSLRALYPLRVGIENAQTGMSLPTLNPYMFLRLEPLHILCNYFVKHLSILSVMPSPPLST